VSREIVDPIEKVAADVAAIWDSCETKNNAGLISLKN
jgi:hypothetical protein